MNAHKMLISLCAIWIVVCTAHAQEPAFKVGCLQMYPQHLRARIDVRDRHVGQALATAGTVAPQFVLRNAKLWTPGQTIKIAFNGGSAELRRKIAETAAEWTTHANLVFDFGNTAGQTNYREWKESDTTMAADIRISFHFRGYWSLLGTDSHNPAIVTAGDASMNFGGFQFFLPGDWQATVRHEFGHALGFEHEHQHPIGGCDDEFRWNDDAGYVPTTDNNGQFIADGKNRRPGIYTVLGGPPNEWPQSTVDFNLRQLSDSSAFLLSDFDRRSIMKYSFDAWMFNGGTASHCFSASDNVNLSDEDIRGAKQAYPRPTDANALKTAIGDRTRALETLIEAKRLRPSLKNRYQSQLESLKQ
jgi:hypothetical protein